MEVSTSFSFASKFSQEDVLALKQSQEDIWMKLAEKWSSDKDGLKLLHSKLAFGTKLYSIP